MWKKLSDQLADLSMKTEEKIIWYSSVLTSEACEGYLVFANWLQQSQRGDVEIV